MKIKKYNAKNGVIELYKEKVNKEVIYLTDLITSKSIYSVSHKTEEDALKWILEHKDKNII